MRNPLQLVLDFLSPLHERTPQALDKSPRTSDSSNTPKPGALRATVGSSAPVQMSDEVSIAHPRANRETVLEGMRVAYLFQRVRRRSIGFLVGPDGLEVRAPKWVTLKEVELGLQERGEWVLRKWAEMQERQKNIRQIEWREGASLDYLGARTSSPSGPTKKPMERRRTR